MFTRIGRQHVRVLDVAVTAAMETTAAVDFRQAAGGAIAIPAEAEITTLAYYGATTPEATPLPLFDSAGNAVAQSVAAGGIYALPDACFGVGVLYLVADAEATVALSLKG